MADDDGNEQLWNKMKLKGIAVIVSGMMAWIFFAPRWSVYFAISVAGGASGFAFIFLIPLLTHWKSTENSLLLGRRLNLVGQYPSKARGLRQSELTGKLNNSTEDESSVGSTSEKVWVLFFLVTGISCLVLPIVACFGILAQP